MLEEDIREITSIPEKKMVFRKEEKERFDKLNVGYAMENSMMMFQMVRLETIVILLAVIEELHTTQLKYRKPNFTPLVFHNLSGYDTHLFIKNLGFSEGNISFTKKVQVGTSTKVVKNEEKTTPLLHQIRFIYSFKFMATSLDKLVNNLSKYAFSNVKRYYTENKLELLTRKGQYPYEYMNSLEKLKETQLPPKEAFYSRLNDEGISDENYAYAQKVWKTFEMKNLEDYHNLCNRVDVLLLADVFENFRDICIKDYNLDPAHYYTAPGLAWDTALKVTKVELELLSDMDMLLMVGKGIRGGVSIISNRYGTANNKYMGNRFDDSKPSKYISYLDANNLCGWAVSKPLPTHGFK